MKPVFYIEDHPNGVMVCENEHEVCAFQGFLYEHGLTWCTGESYLDFVPSPKYNVFNYTKGSHGDIRTYKDWKKEILYFKDFSFNNTDMSLNIEDLY